MTEYIKEITIKYLTGTINQDELEELKRWLESDLKNEEIFNSIKTNWLISDSETRYAKRSKQKVWQKINKRTNSLNGAKTNIRFIPVNNIVKKAAIILLAIGLGAIITNLLNSKTKNIITNANEPVYYDSILITADNGSLSEINLPDGSKVWLNNGSELIIMPSFYYGERIVKLNGEAYFDIKKSTDNHFRVVTSDIQIKVLGTEFNVKSYPEEKIIETTLEEGAITIEKKIGEKIIDIATLKPKEKAIFVKKEGNLKINNTSTKNSLDTKETISPTEKLIIRENVDTKLHTSWKEGHLVFKDEIFENILVLMQRRYNIQIELKNKSLKHLQFTANFKNETIEQALNALKLTHPFKYSFDVKNNKITIE